MFAEVDLSYAGVDISQCYGWKRTAIMDNDEIQLLNTLEKLCKVQNMEGINALLDMPKSAIKVDCKPSKETYIEPDEPTLEITFKNNSKNPIRFLEMGVTPLSVVSYLPNPDRDSCPSGIKPDDYYSTWQNDYYMSPISYPRYLKQLEAQEEFSFMQPIKVEGYGDHKVNIKMSINVLKVFTSNSRSSGGKEITDSECSFKWLKEK